MTIATPFLYVLASLFAQQAHPDSNDEAKQLMLQIAETQYPNPDGPVMSHFTLDLFLRERGEHPREFGFFLLYSNNEKEVFELVIDDVESNTQVRKGFDGKHYWLRKHSEEKQLLTGHEFTEDRDAIDEGLELCGDLMLILDFKQLTKRYPPSTLSTTEDGVRIVEGKITRQQKIFDYRIYINANQSMPHRIEFLAHADDGELTSVQRFSTLAYTEYKGRQIPQVLYEFNNLDPEALPHRIYEIHKLTWGPQPTATSDDKKPSQGLHN
ncbi:MAG: hypothetical protein QGF46_00780 [Planctomycetota bacterium]|nr:hypothetical protein [Planctomycetota bacterium]